MTELREQKCSACHSDSVPVTEAEMPELTAQIPNWKVVTVDKERRLENTYSFPDFQTALDFTNQIGKIAEAEGHHPALLTEWGKVTVTWWTHAISGLHKNDFIMAAKTDEIASSFKE